MCNQLESEQRDIAMEVRSGLEGLRKKVSTANLERVRKIKSRVTRMTGRVSKVREEIKRYLDDDSDMRDMYLTRKLLAELFAAGGGGEMNAGKGPGPTPLGGGGGSGSYYSPRYSVSIAKRRKSGSWNPAGGPTLAARQRSYEQAQMKASADGVLAGDADEEEVSVTLEEDEGAYDQMEPEFHEYHDHKDDDADLQEVEDLLETYFTHIDSTFAELEALDEFIDDTEDFINRARLAAQSAHQARTRAHDRDAVRVHVRRGGEHLRHEPEERLGGFARHVRARQRGVRGGDHPRVCRRRVLHQVQADHVRGQRVGRGRRDERARATIGVMGVKSDDHRPRRRTRLVDLGGR